MEENDTWKPFKNEKKASPATLCQQMNCGTNVSYSQDSQNRTLLTCSGNSPHQDSTTTFPRATSKNDLLLCLRIKRIKRLKLTKLLFCLTVRVIYSTGKKKRCSKRETALQATFMFYSPKMWSHSQTISYVFISHRQC